MIPARGHAETLDPQMIYDREPGKSPSAHRSRGVPGVVEDFGPSTPAEDPAVAKLEARFLHLALAAARDAWADSGLAANGGVDPDRVAVVVGSAMGGLDLLEAEQGRSAKRKGLST